MSPTPSQAAHSMSPGKRFGSLVPLVPLVFALATAMSIAACGGDSENEGQPASERSRAAEATPLGTGELIVFERPAPGAEERDLYVVGPEGGEPGLLRSPGDYPHWSPDGSELAFLACLNPPDCTTAVALLERSTGEVHGFSMPEPDLFTACAIWAPSGTVLACEGTSESDPKRNGVYTLRASDGQGLTQITRNPGGVDAPLAYAPDGDRLVLTRTDPSGAGSALFVTRTGGGRPHRITPWGFTDDYASWSPDGRTIVFGTNGSLYRVSPEGRGLAEIPLEMPDGSSAETAFDVGFSPDGQKIIFSLGSPAPGIYQARLDGGEVERLTTSEDHHANWGPASGS